LRIEQDLRVGDLVQSQGQQRQAGGLKSRLLGTAAKGPPT
jgi:hypothetical protein